MIGAPACQGALYLGEGRTRFRVWAPLRSRIDLHIVSPNVQVVPMSPDGFGYYEAVVERAAPGTRYLYRIDHGLERPDPASRLQPLGVHGPSEVIDPVFPWTDDTWGGLPWPQYVLYELHVGIFTAAGTFDAIVPHLDHLRGLGVTAIEIMPVAQFPGNRNWGYDAVYPYAVQISYGGPAGLKRLVDACHRRGLAVVLDVVYNHLGPEGNYLADFGPYFTERYRTPWGPALNFDGPYSDDVRSYFIRNALGWVTDFHIDGLRLDAVHAISDESAVTFLEELTEAVHLRGEDLRRRVHVAAESAANDARLVRSRELGGFGMDAVWSDDFHHAVHTLIVNERSGYYADYRGLPDVATALDEGFVQTGRYSPFRKHRYGSPSRDIPAQRFIVCSQNHDQVGNRLLGERLTTLASLEAIKLAAGLVLLSPFVPLLFMGEEYGETAPFQYFVSHSDTGLVEAVRKGRREEFAGFGWDQEPPDPQDERTFLQCKLQHDLRRHARGLALEGFYAALLRLRKECPAIANLSKETMRVLALDAPKALLVRRWREDSAALLAYHFGDRPATLKIPRALLGDDGFLPLRERAPDVMSLRNPAFLLSKDSAKQSEAVLSQQDDPPSGAIFEMTPPRWRKCFDSNDERWLGAGKVPPDRLDAGEDATVALAPFAFVVFLKERTGA